MQIKAYLHRYSVSPCGFFPRPTKGIFVPSKIAVLKIAAFHCSFGVINSTIRIIRRYDLETHAWLNTFIKQWQSRKQKIAKSHQNTANQWGNAINEQTCVSNESELWSHFLSFLTYHRRIRIRGYLCSFPITWSPHPHPSPPPPSRLRNIPPVSVIGSFFNTKKTHPFPWFSRKSSRDKRPKSTSFPEKMGTRMRCDPLLHSSGAGEPGFSKSRSSK